MLTDLHIQNFRGLRALGLNDTAAVNLIVGRNDSGKTTLLEAIRLLLTGDPSHLRRFSRSRVERRPLDIEQGFRLAFYQCNPENDLIVRGIVGLNTLTARARIAVVRGEEALQMQFESDEDSSESGESLLQPGYEIIVDVSAENDAHAVIRQSLSGTAEVTMSRSQHRNISPSFPAIPPLVWLGTNRSEAWMHARRYSDLFRRGGAPALLEILRSIEPRLRSLLVLTNRSERNLYSGPVLEVDLGMEATLPLESMGDGFSSTIDIISAVGGARNGVCLIDEVENGLHYSLLPEVFRSVGAAAREFNSQVWATTHSYDCIAAARIAFEGAPELLRVHRLDRGTDGEVIVHTFDHAMLDRAYERGLEVR